MKYYTRLKVARRTWLSLGLGKKDEAVSSVHKRAGTGDELIRAQMECIAFGIRGDDEREKVSDTKMAAGTFGGKCLKSTPV